MNYALSTTPAFAALSDGLVIMVRFPSANTGGDSLNINNIGAYPLVKENTSGVDQLIVAGDILAGQMSLVSWSAVLSSWVLVTGANTIPNATANNEALARGQALQVVPVTALGYSNSATSISATTASLTAPCNGFFIARMVGSNGTVGTIEATSAITSSAALTSLLTPTFLTGSYSSVGTWVFNAPSGVSSTFTATLNSNTAEGLQVFIEVTFIPTP